MQMVATLLGAMVLVAIAITYQSKQERALSEAVYHAEVLQAARQQASFARAVKAYAAANPTLMVSGLSLTPGALQASSVLSPGFPAANPFGQTPVAFVGSNGTILATYTGPPSQAVLAPLNLNSSSNMNLEALANEEGSDLAAMQAGDGSLIGGMLEDGIISAPDQSFQAPVSTYFAGVTLPAGPVSADLVNVLPVATPIVPNISLYQAVTGD